MKPCMRSGETRAYTYVLGPQWVIGMSFNALFLSQENALETTWWYTDTTALWVLLSIQMNYCNNFITASFLVLVFKATIQYIFAFCLVAFGPVALPGGDVIHASERGGQFIQQESGKSKGWE